MWRTIYFVCHFWFETIIFHMKRCYLLWCFQCPTNFSFVIIDKGRVGEKSFSTRVDSIFLPCDPKNRESFTNEPRKKLSNKEIEEIWVEEFGMNSEANLKIKQLLIKGFINFLIDMLAFNKHRRVNRFGMGRQMPANIIFNRIHES